MPDTLIRGALTPEGTVDVLVSGNLIQAVGENLAVRQTDTSIINAEGKLLWPGLINTHHHSAQSLLKGVPAGIDRGLDDWLGAVPFAAWPHLTADSIYIAARVCFAEMLRSGCTTCVDHYYLYSHDTDPAMEAAVFQAATEMGIRLVLARGGSTHAGSHAGQRTQRMTESIDTCVKRLQDTCAVHHDDDAYAMSRVVVAPTSLVHSSTPEDLKTLAAFARSRGLRMHSHLLEVERDEIAAQEKYGLSAIDYAESVNWLGDDVWFAHLVACDDNALEKLAATKTGVAHCPVSNARLGSGIAKVPEMAQRGMQISVGVDGSASAESGSLINELMQTWLMHRADGGAQATDARTILRWASEDAGNLLRLKVGCIAPGYAADLLLFDLSEPRFHGVFEPALAPILCGEPILLSMVMVNGRTVVRDNQVAGLDYDELRRSAVAEVRRLRQYL